MLSRSEAPSLEKLGPEIEEKAQHGLNQLVLSLMQRVVQKPEERASRLGILHVIDDPVLADEVLKTPTLFQKNFSLVASLGESRFNLNGERWALFRDRTQRAYNRASKPEERPDIEAIYARALEKVDGTNAGALEPALIEAALTVFARALNITPDLQSVLKLFPEIRTQAKLLQYFSWSGSHRIDALLARSAWLDAHFNEIVLADPRTHEFVQQSITGLSLDEWAPAVTDVMQNMFAGIETTASTLSWALHLVGQNQDLQDAIRREADEPFLDRKLTRSFLWETMRCFPPIPFVVRELSADYSGHGHRFAKGEQVILSILGIHRDGNHWARANEFHAARDEFSDAQQTPLAFRPFLSGPRVCGGKRLAEMELLIGLPLILKRWRITTSSADIGYDYALALRPRSLDGVYLEAVRA